ncbi:putative baseplate assembly protein [Arthrobacter antioxidans]|uniref:putative baseplate assembly protein n=1 Tax=Arthrobacter antioxidans TaxID=2895818 RepID=UPI0020001757|nr:putative baseplate assembly protein [Arthrobacter antioxidans]
MSVEPGTPRISNRPGLPAIRYRLRAYPQFRGAMLARLAFEMVEGRVPLRDLTARRDDDFGIALIDLWSYVADILTFYQERSANEAYLGTARQPESLRRLAAMLDYRPVPGIAASAQLAFTLHPPTPAAQQTLISGSLRAQSVPAQGEKPQKFETLQPRLARYEWNRLRPVTHRPQDWNQQTAAVQLDGQVRSLSTGCPLLLVGFEHDEDPGTPRWDLRRVQSVRPGPENTTVALDKSLAAAQPDPHRQQTGPAAYAMRATASLFGFNAPMLAALPEVTRRQLAGHDFKIMTTTKESLEGESGRTIVTTTDIVSATEKPLPPLPADWDFGKSPPDGRDIDLDAVYPVLPNSWLVLERPGTARLYRVDGVATQARNDFLLTGKVTRLTLHSGEGVADFKQDPRRTAVHLTPEPLRLGQEEVAASFPKDWLDVQGSHTALERGRPLLISGPAAPAELAELARVEAAGADTRLFFSKPLAHSYDRIGLTVYANVAAAAHGEAAAEVLGSGDASQPFQAFTLKKSPLTYRVQAGAPNGATSTLQVRVDGVLWTESRSFYGHGPQEPVYTTVTAGDGSTTVRFGDGVTGRRLPTGRGNVTADYRHGLGAAGNVSAGTITTLLDRPLGLKSVLNLLPAAGGAEPEPAEALRRNAPNTVRTFGRIVSLRDFEDAAREYAGIAKARAVVEWDGETQLVRLTVAGDGGATLPAGADTHTALLADLDARRDTNRVLQLDSYAELPLQLAATVLVDAPTFRPDDVLAAVRDAVADHFSFDRLDLGGRVNRSDLYPVFHSVAGVLAVRIHTFRAVPSAGEEGTTPPLSTAVVPASHQLMVLEDPRLAGLTTTTEYKEAGS